MVFDKPQWQPFEKLKRMLTSQPVLQFYDPSRQTKVATNSSKLGLGAVLHQKHDDYWKPVAYASCATSRAEQNYCPLERETLSVPFGCTKFHEFLYATQFKVENDHRPLQPIFSKSITKAPPRIQRFLLAMQRYNFELAYVPGKQSVIPDTLS